MTSEEQKIIDIVVKYEDAINGVVKFEKQINELKNVQKQLNEQLKAGDIAVEEYNQQMVATDSAVRQYKDNIRVLRNEIKNNLKQEQEQIGSLKRLRAELSNANKAYDELSRAERESARGTEMLKHIQDISDEISTAEAASRRFYRNVGNYASGWDGLGMSVQQILRELPNAAVSMNTFFLAISNNIPMLVDQINMLRAANKEAAAAGNATVPIWKSLAGAFFSWNTAISLGVTLLTLYGGKIVEWISELVKGEKQVNYTKEAMDGVNEAMRSGEAEAQKDIVTLNLLYNATQDVTKSLDERKRAVKELQDQYPEYFSNLSEEEILAGKATDAYNRLSDAIIRSARARAAEDKLVENSKKILELEEKRAQLEKERQKAQTVYNKQLKLYNNLQGEAADFQMSSVNASRRNVNNLTEDITEANRQISALLTANKKLAKNIDIRDLTATPGTATKKGRAKRTPKDRTEQINKGNIDISKQLYESETNLILSEYAKRRKALLDNYSAEIKDLRNKLEHDKDLTEESRNNINKIIINKQKKLQLDLSNLEIEQQRGIQDQLIQLISDEYEKRREIISVQYDRQIQDLENQLKNSEGLALQDIDSITTQIIALREKRYKELDALSNEQMQKDIQAQIDNTNTQLEYAEGNIERELQLKQQQLEQERELRKLQAQQQITDQEELRQKLLQIDEEYNAKELMLMLQSITQSVAERQKANQIQVQDEQKKWTAIAGMTSAASSLARSFGEENKTLTMLSKTLALASVAINTGVAISKAIAAAAGNPLGFVQIAGIISQVLSAMATATSIIKSAKFAKGGLVTGKGTGTSDSIPARLSNGESVMTAKATSMFSPLLSTFNQLGGGVPITINTSSASVGEDFLAAAVAKGFMMCPAPVVSVEEISRVQKRVKTIQNISRI